VLLHLVRSIYPDVPAVFCDTGLEYPEIREFVKTRKGVEIIRPKTSFKQVLDIYGYPIVTKRVAGKIWQYRNTKSESFKEHLINGYKLKDGTISKRFSIPNCWKYLLHAPFKISDKCCDIMKKKPFKDFEKNNQRVSITGEMAVDSEMRLRHYLLSGCNAFQYKHPKSTPLGFWTTQDILLYLKEYEIPYCSVYGDIGARENGELLTTGADRTGCIFCMFGICMEKGINRFMRMQTTHPKLWDYCINKLGCGKVLSYIGIQYRDMFADIKIHKKQGDGEK
jgi:3'-phosphoadenosine 5'-phosphosulfate sulfotransferase (PAPS reductase)/FAD synthetase